MRVNDLPVLFLKAKKISEQPHMVLTGWPPRWHKYDPAQHAGGGHLHAVHTVGEAEAVQKLTKLHGEHWHETPVGEQKEAIAAHVKAENLKAYVKFWLRKVTKGITPQKAEHAAVMGLVQSNPKMAAEVAQKALAAFGGKQVPPALDELISALGKPAAAPAEPPAAPESAPDEPDQKTKANLEDAAKSGNEKFLQDYVASVKDVAPASAAYAQKLLDAMPKADAGEIKTGALFHFDSAYAKMNAGDWKVYNQDADHFYMHRVGAHTPNQSNTVTIPKATLHEAIKVGTAAEKDAENPEPKTPRVVAAKEVPPAPALAPGSLDAPFEAAIKDAWENAIGPDGTYILKHEYPAEITLNGKTVRFAVRRDSAGGKFKLKSLWDTPHGKVFRHFEMQPGGKLVHVGDHDLFALTESARQGKIAEFNALFDKTPTPVEPEKVDVPAEKPFTSDALIAHLEANVAEAKAADEKAAPPENSEIKAPWLVKFPKVMIGGKEWAITAKGATRDDGMVFMHVASLTEGSHQKNGFNPKQMTLWIDPKAVIPAPDTGPAVSAPKIVSAAEVSAPPQVPDFVVGKNKDTTPYYKKVAQQVIDKFNAGDAEGLHKMVKPTIATWAGKSPNSKILVKLHADLTAKLFGGSDSIPKPEAQAEKPQDAEEAGPKDGDTKAGADGQLVFKDGRWHKVEQKPTHPLVAMAEAKGFKAVKSAKGVFLAGATGKYPKDYTNKTQAQNAAAKMEAAGVDASVIGDYPYHVLILGENANAAPALPTPASVAPPASTATSKPGGLTDAEIPEADFNANLGVVEAAKTLAKNGDVAALEAYADKLFNTDFVASANYCLDLADKIKAKAKSVDFNAAWKVANAAIKTMPPHLQANLGVKGFANTLMLAHYQDASKPVDDWVDQSELDDFKALPSEDKQAVMEAIVLASPEAGANWNKYFATGKTQSSMVSASASAPDAISVPAPALDAIKVPSPSEWLDTGTLGPKYTAIAEALLANAKESGAAAIEWCVQIEDGDLRVEAGGKSAVVIPQAQAGFKWQMVAFVKQVAAAVGAPLNWNHEPPADIAEKIALASTPQTVPAGKTVNIKGAGNYTKKADGTWVDPDGSVAQVGSYSWALAQLMAGGDIAQSKVSGLKGDLADQAIDNGVKPTTVLNKVFPGGKINGPQEGDVKVIKGVSYVLQNGRWHKVGEDAPQQPASMQEGVHAVDALQLPELDGFKKYNTKQNALDAIAYMKEQIKAGNFDVLKGSTLKAKTGKLHSKLPLPSGQIVKVAGYSGPYQSLYNYVEALKVAAGKKPKGKVAPKIASATMTSAPSATPAAGSMDSIDGWQKVGAQGGYNPGGTYKDPSSVEWYCKFPDAGEAVVKNELLALKLYAAAGNDVPEVKMVTQSGKVGLASKIIAGVTEDKAKLKSGEAHSIFGGFAADAWLANWDCVGNNPAAGKGFDNIQFTPDGKAHRIDAGGAMTYKGTGAKKPSGEFGDTVVELKTLRDPSVNANTAAAFKGMSEADVAASVAKVLAIPDAKIASLVNEFGPGSTSDKAALTAKLIARKANMAEQFPKAQKAAKEAAKGVPAVSGDLSWVTLNPGEKIVDSGEQFGVQFAKIAVPAKGFNAAGIQKPPTYTHSSSKFVNAQNTADLQKIYDLAVSGAGVDAVENMTFDQIVKETGEKTGKQVGINEHRSVKYLKEYFTQVVAELKAQTHPTFRTVHSGSFVGSYAAATRQIGKLVGRLKYGDFSSWKEKAGDYLILDRKAGEGIPHPEPGQFQNLASGSAEFKAFKAASDKGFHALSSTEQNACKAYTGSAYVGWNAALRTGDIGSSGFQKAEVMKKAFDKASVELPEGIILHRGIGVGSDTYKSVIGAVIQDGSFQSTSFGTKAAFSSYTTQLRLHIAKGVKGMMATTFSGHSENEVILAPNCRYLVMKVETTGGKSYVDVMVLPHEDE